MEYSENAALHALVTRQRIGLVTDFDGTISQTAPTPDEAKISPRSHTLLQALAETLALTAAVSGRAADDLRERIGLETMVYVGNHGLERWHDGRIDALPAALTYRPGIERVIEAIKPHMEPGLFLQDKRITFALHYRGAADPDAARAALLPVVEAASRANGLSWFEGKRVFEVLPPLQVDKGTALTGLVEDYALDGVLYLGDDITDAAALRQVHALRQTGRCMAVGVGVESAETPAAVRESADLLVPGVAGVESLLQWLHETVSAA